jgi:hypothetical protein
MTSSERPLPFHRQPYGQSYHQPYVTAKPVESAGPFKRTKPADVAEILETLVTMGRARQRGEKFSR